MMAQTESAETPAETESSPLIYPAGERPVGVGGAEAGVGGMGGSWTFALIVGAAAGGVWWWQRKRVAGQGGAAPGSLKVEQSRPLGNRQFLVVASCDGRRLLLGVAPGQINLLCDLNEQPVAPVEGVKS